MVRDVMEQSSPCGYIYVYLLISIYVYIYLYIYIYIYIEREREKQSERERKREEGPIEEGRHNGQVALPNSLEQPRPPPRVSRLHLVLCFR